MLKKPRRTENVLDSNYTLSALAGAALWEVTKQLWSAIVKRSGDRAESLRKLIREECAALADLVIELQELAEAHYQLDPASNEGKASAASIRAKLKACGIRFQCLNARLVEANKQKLASSLLIKFRSAVSIELDVVSRALWLPDDAKYLAIYRAATQLSHSLSSTKFANV